MSKGVLCRPFTDRHKSEYRGHLFRVSGIFPSTYNQDLYNELHFQLPGLNETRVVEKIIHYIISPLTRAKTLYVSLYLNYKRKYDQMKLQTQFFWWLHFCSHPLSTTPTCLPCFLC